MKAKVAPTLPDPFLTAGGQDLPGPLQRIREARSQALAAMPLPTRKTENWKYSSRHLQLDDSLAGPLSGAGMGDELPRPPAYRAVIRNGRLDAQASELPQQEGVQVSRFADLDEVTAQRLSERLESTLDAETTQLAQLNTARFEDGLFIRLAPQAKLDKPLYVMVDNDASQSGSAYPRLYVEAGQDSEITLVEEYWAAGDQPILVDAVTELNLDTNAKVTHVRLSLEPEHVRHVGATGALLQGGAHLDSHTVGFGGDLRRHDLQVRLEQEEATCRLNGVVVTQNRQHFDNHTVIDHVAPHCTSEETYRCIAAGKSHAIFNGRIHIHRDAQKSLAEMNNKNLLLSSEAEIDTKPELEIYADDVKCAHGATVGQLDDEALFYLVSRGIDRNQAATLLSMAFINELVGQIPLEEVRDTVDAQIAGFIHETFEEA
ncbi:Fe-S cluster assembly protein SufD [Marinobacteraceae bacterium S3BR75-40.1]